MVYRTRNMRRSLRLLCLPVLALALVGALAVSATSASATASGVYFKNAWDNLCIVPNGHGDVAVRQVPCANTPVDQWWSNPPADPGNYVEIRNSEYTSQCLGVAGNSAGEGALVFMWNCNGLPNQYWEPVNCDGVGVACQYLNLNSGLYLSVDGCNDNSGDNINQWGWVPLPGGYCQWWNWGEY
jgi:hypothetical protein